MPSVVLLLCGNFSILHSASFVNKYHNKFLFEEVKQMEDVVQEAVSEFKRSFGNKHLNIKNLVSYVHSEFNCNVFFL